MTEAAAASDRLGTRSSSITLFTASEAGVVVQQMTRWTRSSWISLRVALTARAGSEPSSYLMKLTRNGRLASAAVRSSIRLMAATAPVAMAEAPPVTELTTPIRSSPVVGLRGRGQEQARARRPASKGLNLLIYSSVEDKTGRRRMRGPG